MFKDRTITVKVGGEGIEPPRLKNHSSFTDWYYVANSRHPPTMGHLGFEPRTNRLKAGYSTAELMSQRMW